MKYKAESKFVLHFCIQKKMAKINILEGYRYIYKLKETVLYLFYDQKYLEHDGTFCCFWVPKNTKFSYNEGNGSG